MKEKNFHSVYSHGFIRAAVAIPEVKVANPAFNVEKTVRLCKTASGENAALIVFPELGISGYSNEDLFQQDALQEASLDALKDLCRKTRALVPVIIVGFPFTIGSRLFNCSAVLYKGDIIAIIPKTYLPNYREFYEKRQFCSGADAGFSEVSLFGRTVPFGNDLVIESPTYPGFSFFVEICEDLWAPIPPSTFGALAGANVLVNLSASNITIGKADYRKKIAGGQSGKCISAYLYAAAGGGESTTDLAWDGHGMIWENGNLLAETERFRSDDSLIYSDIDLERLSQERSRVSSFRDSIAAYSEKVRAIRKIPFSFEPPPGRIVMKRTVERFPYVPVSVEERDSRCGEAYNIQVHGLAKRLKSSGIKKIVIGCSGGLDSTHSLIVAARTMDLLSLPRKNVLAYTMPGFATGSRTRENALKLMQVLGVSSKEIDIRPSCMQMLKDLGHPFSMGKKIFDITFENVQAGERTSHLFRLSNQNNGIVLGTGDLSELALGWCTYGVGDHMSHYNVNASVPKTLIQYLIKWVVASKQFGEDANEIFESILDTEISPELVPSRKSKRQPDQSTESAIGPYELQDFNLYYVTRFGFRPSKVAFLAFNAWSDRNNGVWPREIPLEKRHEYSLSTLRKWLGVFLSRFFGNTQFKRTCVPNGPKVGSGGSLSPRGDWRAPSDSEATIWLDELEKNIPLK